MKQVIQGPSGKPIKLWTDYVEAGALQKLVNLTTLPFVLPSGVAGMPDIHDGIGSAVGTVIATDGAVIPAAVGVDIGCGMIARQTTLRAEDIPTSVSKIRADIERAVPHGTNTIQGRYVKGSFSCLPNANGTRWRKLSQRYFEILSKHPGVDHDKVSSQLGTLGGGNHFIELCLDQEGVVWVMLHSGSRGVGNNIGRYFIELARKDMRVHHINLPDKDLAYLSEGTEHFDEYIGAMTWAQDYAMENREAMMDSVLATMRDHFRPFQLGKVAVNCHHNYTTREHHFGRNVWLTRKGAVRAREGDLGIIPGSMGAKSFIVSGLGNPDSYHSCSHGAGRAMSRSQAKATFTLEDAIEQTQGVECRKDAGIIDEIPQAYKDIDEVMDNQKDLVKIEHTLKQFLCVKG